MWEDNILDYKRGDEILDYKWGEKILAYKWGGEDPGLREGGRDPGQQVGGQEQRIQETTHCAERECICAARRDDVPVGLRCY